MVKFLERRRLGRCRFEADDVLVVDEVVAPEVTPSPDAVFPVWEPTGNADVDGALDSLHALADTDVTQHVGVFGIAERSSAALNGLVAEDEASSGRVRHDRRRLDAELVRRGEISSREQGRAAIEGAASASRGLPQRKPRPGGRRGPDRTGRRTRSDFVSRAPTS